MVEIQSKMNVNQALGPFLSHNILHKPPSTYFIAIVVLANGLSLEMLKGITACLFIGN